MKISSSAANRRLTAFAVIAAALLALAPAASAAERKRERIPDRYVVVYKDSVANVDRATGKRERAHGFRARHRYRSALKGFSARLSAAQVKRLRSDPAVDFVAPDRPVHASGAVAAGDSVPTGVRRMEAGSSTTVHGASSVGVAVIDTGIDLGHADLGAQVAGGKNCIDSTKSPQDDHGHGTHVAGSVAAANNGSGVVGVAPGTKLFAVKVLDARGSGSTSTVVCGIDWVTANAAGAGIRVANMSLGGGGDPIKSCAETTDPQHVAICKSTAAGVAYAVAAGNSGWDFDYEPMPDVPAAYPQVVTAAAMSDSDGKAGAAGSNCSGEADDRYASFSNFAWTTAGAAHTIAAPGVCITSTKLGGGTTSMSGTSMASPHIAGAMALCVGEGSTSGPCAGLAANDPSAWIAELTKNRATSYGFLGDPNQPLSGGQYFGFLGWVGLSEESTTSPDTTAPAAPSGLTATAADASVSLDWADNGESDLAGYNVYRSTTAGGPYTKLTASPVGASSYADSAVSNGTTYYYVVTAVDGSGNESQPSSEVSAQPEASSASPLSLTASGYKIKGVQHADLKWTGGGSTEIDVYRDDKQIDRTANDGAYTDKIGNKGGGTYRYKVCEAGTATCSSEVTVSF